MAKRAIKKKKKRKKTKKPRKRRAREPKKVPQHMSLCDAAEAVLRKEGKALKHTELAKKAIDEGLVHSASKTPGISMHVSLRGEMKRREQRNEPQRFAFLGNGLFALLELITGPPPKKTRTAIDQVLESRREACLELYKKLTAKNQGDNFETMVADLLIAMGYQNVEVVGGKDDQGVDIVCEMRDGILLSRVAIQCKCKSLANKIGPKDVSTLRDNLSTYQCQQGILITTSELNLTARAKAKEAGKDPVHFIEHEELLSLLAENSIGIRCQQVKHYQVDSSQYDFLK